MKIVLLNIRRYGDKSILGYDLTQYLFSYFNHHSPTLKIDLPTGTIYLSKYAYLNRYKIFQSVDKDVFFMVFNYKRPNNKIVLDRLLKHRDRVEIPVLKQRAKYKKTA